MILDWIENWWMISVSLCSLHGIIIHSSFFLISMILSIQSFFETISVISFGQSIIFFSSTYQFQWVLKTDGSMRMKQCGRVWKYFQVELLGQRFGLKVKEVLYHEKSEYQVWNGIENDSEGYSRIRLRKLWKSACFGWSNPSDRKRRVCLSRDDYSSSSLCSSQSKECRKWLDWIIFRFWLLEVVMEEFFVKLQSTVKLSEL